MSTRVKALVLATFVSLAAVGCSTTGSSDERGSTERTASNVGRVVDDSVITGKVKAALVADPTTKAHQIEVETFKGTVQLSGFVDDAEARRRAGEVAKNIEGVKDVKNSLTLRNKTG
jgi:osmotically-inducible protein OsmY